MPDWIAVCDLDDIDEEDVARFDHGGRTFIVVRDDDGEVFCADGLCPHEAVHLCDGLVIGASIECPKHSSVFDCRTGRVETPPAVEGLQTYPAKVEDGKILVHV